MKKNMKKILFIIIACILIASSFAQEPSIIEKTTSISRPAIVYIQLILKGDVTYPEYSQNIKTDEEGILYFDASIAPTSFLTTEIKAEYSGSGSFINPEGYILTNAHVVSFANETEMYRDLNFAMMDFAGELTDNVIANLTGDIPAGFRSDMAQYIDNYSNISKPRTEIYVLTGIADPKDNGVPAVVIKIGGPYPDKDVAIIKTDIINRPSVYLGDSDILDVGTPIFVIGYPGVAEISEESMLEPSVTAGIISAKKASEQGWPLLQIDAAISGGNSGGPVFDSRGEVIGIATLGSTETQGFNWIVPINIVKEFMQEAGIENYHSEIDKYYLSGMKLYWEEECDRSIKELTNALAIYPEDTYALKYIADCHSIVEKKEQARKRTAIIGLSASSAIIFILLLLIFIIKGKRKK